MNGAGILTIVGATAAIATTIAAGPCARITDVREDTRDLRGEVTDLGGEVADLRGEVAEVNKEIHGLIVKLEGIGAKADTILDLLRSPAQGENDPSP